MTLGIRKRRVRPEDDPEFQPPIETLSESGISPRSYGSDPADEALAERLVPSYSPAAPNLNPSGQAEALPSRGRMAASPNQPASSSIDETVLRSVVRPKRARQADSMDANRDELSSLRNNPAKDTNGRVKSAVWNAFMQMADQANRALASGRPIDEYALAGVAGRGIGGAARGAFDPSVDDEYKRKSRMADLEHQIGEQLKAEQAAAENAKTKAETDYLLNTKPELEAMKARAAEGRNKPKPFVIAGRRIGYRRPADWQGDPDDWEPYEESVDGKALVDTSKAPDAAGLLPSDKLRATLTREQIAARAQLAENNNRFKEAENEKTRKQQDRQFRAALSERIAARLESDKQANVRADQAVTRIKISIARAKIEAKREHADLNDYLDALADAGVEVVDK